MCSHCRSYSTFTWLGGRGECFCLSCECREIFFDNGVNTRQFVLYENECRLVACSMTSTMVTAVDLGRAVPPGLNFTNTEQCNELWSDRLRLSLGSWILGKRLGNRFTGGRAARGFSPRSWRCQPVVPQTYHPLQNSRLLHFSGESLWPRSAGAAINPVKTALCYLLYLKMVFIDWNFPELIWPNVKFTIHTIPASVNEGKVPYMCKEEGGKSDLVINEQQSIK